MFPIYKPLPRGPGSSTSLARCLQEQKGLLQGEDLEQEQDTDEPVKKRGGCGAQQPNITVDGMKMVAEFKTTKRKLMNKVKCVQPCFSMYICAKQAQMETGSPLVHPGTEKAIGVDMLVPRSSTPLDILRMGVARWTFVLGYVWLGHRVITNHVCAQDVKRSYPRSIEDGEFTLIIKDWNLRSKVTSDDCEGGGVTWELVSEYFNIPQHFHTYSRVRCKV